MPFLLYILSEVKTLNSPAFVHEKFHSAATIEDEVWGTEVSILGAISIDSTAIFIAVADSHDEEEVVLPRG
jgi:hypothetical protein